MPELTESQVKNAVAEYLEWQQNLGELWFERLNAGDYIEARGETRRRIKGAKKGTADFIVVQGGVVQMQNILHQEISADHPIAFVTFIECKETKWKPSKKPGDTEKSQREFAERVTKLNCRYVIVRDVDEAIEALRR